MQVHKFGGTCVATADRITDAAEHIIAVHREAGEQQMVVVSAMGSHPSSPIKVMHPTHGGRGVDTEGAHHFCNLLRDMDFACSTSFSSLFLKWRYLNVSAKAPHVNFCH